MQETWVRSPIREDPTSRGATKPVRHNYWACALELPLLKLVLWSLFSATRSPRTATKSSPHSALEKKPSQQGRPSTAQNLKVKKKLHVLYNTRNCIQYLIIIYNEKEYIYMYMYMYIRMYTGFPGGSDGKTSAYNVGDLGSIPGLGRSPWEGNGNPLQYSCLENSMNGGAW